MRVGEGRVAGDLEVRDSDVCGARAQVEYGVDGVLKTCTADVCWWPTLPVECCG